MSEEQTYTRAELEALAAEWCTGLGPGSRAVYTALHYLGRCEDLEGDRAESDSRIVELQRALRDRTGELESSEKEIARGGRAFIQHLVDVGLTGHEASQLSAYLASLRETAESEPEEEDSRVRLTYGQAICVCPEDVTEKVRELEEKHARHESDIDALSDLIDELKSRLRLLINQHGLSDLAINNNASAAAAEETRIEGRLRELADRVLSLEGLRPCELCEYVGTDPGAAPCSACLEDKGSPGFKEATVKPEPAILCRSCKWASHDRHSSNPKVGFVCREGGGRIYFEQGVTECNVYQTTHTTFEFDESAEPRTCSACRWFPAGYKDGWYCKRLGAAVSGESRIGCSTWEKRGEQ